MSLAGKCSWSSHEAGPAPQNVGTPGGTHEIPRLVLDTSYRSCALKSTHTVCWGGPADASGRGLRDTSRGGDVWGQLWSRTPAHVERNVGMPVLGIAGTVMNSCYIGPWGVVYCGNKSLNLEATAIASAGSQSCVLDTRGRVRCFVTPDVEENPGKLPRIRDVPLKVEAHSLLLLSSYPRDDGLPSGCVGLADGRVSCWIERDSGTTGTLRVDVTDVTEFKSATGLFNWGNQVCAAKSWGPVVCREIPGMYAPSLMNPDLDRFCSRSWDLFPRALGTYRPPIPPDTVFADTKTGGAGSRGCTVSSGGQLYCFGPNDFGEVGDGSMQPRPSLVKVPLEGVQQVRVGANHACATTERGEVYCWGANNEGQLGKVLLEARLLRFPEGRRIVDFSIETHGCAVLDDGATYCWGFSHSGEAGKRAHYVEPPAPVAGQPRARRVFVSQAQSCVEAEAGTVHCWGDHELAAGKMLMELPPPMRIKGVRHPRDMVEKCLLQEDGAVYCWGGAAIVRGAPYMPNYRIGCTYPAAGARRVPGAQGTSIAAVEHDVWIIDKAGKVIGLGLERSRQGSEEPPVLVPLPLPGPARSLALNKDSGSCVVLESGKVWCTDRRSFYEETPHLVPELDGVNLVRKSARSTCALLDTGKVLCWGNSPFRIGEMLKAPRPVAGLDDAEELAMSQSGVGCTRRADGSWWCWDPVTGTSPRLVPELKGARDVKGGKLQVCGVVGGNTVACYGTWLFSPRPVRVEL